MSFKSWEKKVLAQPGARERVAEIEREFRLAAGLTDAREVSGLSQRDLAKRMGVSQPRVAQIEGAGNVTVEVLQDYAHGLGAVLEVRLRVGNRRIDLLVPARAPSTSTKSRTKPATGKRTVPRNAPTKVAAKAAAKTVGRSSSAAGTGRG